MIDVGAVLTPLLAADAAIAAQVGSRVWGGLDAPVVGYTPSVGAAIVFRVRGGSLTGEQRSVLVEPSVQFKIYGATDLVADATYRALADFFARSPLPWPLRAAVAESLGMPLNEPDLDWPFILTYYRLVFANVE